MCARRTLPFRRKQEFALMPSSRLQTVVNALLGPEALRLRKTLEHIINRNAALGGTADIFTYQGAVYRSTSGVMFHDEIRPLHETLHDELDIYLMLHQKLSDDAAAIVQGMSPAITRCTSLEDIRDVLPEFLVSLDDEMKAMMRGREPGFLVADVPFKFEQFQKAEELAGYYAANRILYA